MINRFKFHFTKRMKDRMALRITLSFRISLQAILEVMSLMCKVLLFPHNHVSKTANQDMYNEQTLE